MESGKIKVKHFIILVLLIFGFSIPSFAVQKGQVQYTIPIDYSLFNESELNSEAESFYKDYLKTNDEKMKQMLLVKMLSDYCILAEINKGNPLYFTRLGIIYDKLGKDRYAKSNFFRSTNLVPDYPYSFYSFGNYFFERKDYKKALREYLKAYNCGYDNDYDNLYQIGTVYEKFGDFSESIKFFKKALVVKDSEELRAKILKLEEIYEANPLYDQRQRIVK